MEKDTYGELLEAYILVRGHEAQGAVCLAEVRVRLIMVQIEKIIRNS